MDNQYRISEEEYVVLCRHPQEVRKLLRRLDVLDREIDVIGPKKLIRDCEIISRLLKAGNYSTHSHSIDDKKYLLSSREGEVVVKYGILSYSEIAILLGIDPDSKQPLGSLQIRKVCELKKGIRCPAADEALLLPAEDHNIGRERAYVAVIHNSDDVFYVRYDKDGRRRFFQFDLDTSSRWSSSYDEYGASCEFVFVIE
jgi:hypothetical protein